jgi:hypothetical protein
MGQSASSDTNTTNLREDPTRWLWIPLLGIVAIGAVVLWLLAMIATASMEAFHKEPILSAAGLVYIAGCVCGICGWLTVQRKRIHPFLCDLGYSIAAFVGGAIRFCFQLIRGVILLCTILAFVLFILSGVSNFFGTLNSFVEAPIGVKPGAAVGFFASLTLPLLIVFIVLAIATYVGIVIDEKLALTEDSRPQA